VVSALVLNMLVAHAFGPYSSNTTGYDISYPQCNSATLPSGAFGIVGVTDGRPFTSNPCFTSLKNEYGYASASGIPSLYFNTGYAGAYRKNITQACRSGPSQAWMIGCSEADYAATRAGGLGVAMWWLDVEVGNSWSTRNLSLNQQTIQGAVDRLSSGGYVGVYSTASSWRTITGGSFTPTGSSADWVAGGSCSTPFDANKVWLSQYTSGGFDYDTAC
jgi:hypothetical protein